MEEEASTKNQQHASIKVDVELKQQVAFPAFTQLMGFSLLSMVVNSMMVCAKDMLGPSKGKHISHRLLVKTHCSVNAHLRYRGIYLIGINA